MCLDKPQDSKLDPNKVRYQIESDSPTILLIRGKLFGYDLLRLATFVSTPISLCLSACFLCRISLFSPTEWRLSHTRCETFGDALSLPGAKQAWLSAVALCSSLTSLWQVAEVTFM